MQTNLLTHDTLPNVQALLREFGVLSGYKVNTLKTEALIINLSEAQVDYLKANFKLSIVRLLP